MTKTNNRRYWLMKSEPSSFSWEDLKNEKNRTTCWDGVRNYQARNLMRDEIKAGDGVFFYHSNIPSPAIVGIAEVVREGYPDDTAMDPDADHYDPRASRDNPVWYMVDIRSKADLPTPITRNDMRRHPVLSQMGVMKKGNRLSVQPVTKPQWQAVLEHANIKDPLI